MSKYTFDTAENAYNQAKASVAQYKAQVNRAKVNLGYCTITAPVAGSIGEIPVRTGDQVSPSTYLTTVSGNAAATRTWMLNSLCRRRSCQ